MEEKMATVGEISAPMKLIDENFTFNSTDLDASEVHHKLNLLQTLNPSPDADSKSARSELKSFCENSDGLALWRFITQQPAVWPELSDAYRYAPDAAAMVLDVVQGFDVEKTNRPKGTTWSEVRPACVVMLQELIRVKPAVSPELREKAMEVALQLKPNQLGGFGVLGFLLLVGVYGLRDRFSIDDLMDWFVTVAKRRRAVDLCRSIIPADQISNVIKKLLDKGIVATAVELSIEFDKTNEFPPVPLLKEYRLKTLNASKKQVKNIQNKAIQKELAALMRIIRCIDEYHLGSEYPKGPLVAAVKELENLQVRPRKQERKRKQKRIRIQKARSCRSCFPSDTPADRKKWLTWLDHNHVSPSGSRGVAGPTPSVGSNGNNPRMGADSSFSLSRFGLLPLYLPSLYPCSSSDTSF